MEFWQIYGIIMLVGLILYTWKIKLFTLQFNPFGVSTTILNSYLEGIGSRHSQFFKKIGRVGYNIFGWGSILLTSFGVVLLISLFMRIFINLPNLNIIAVIDPIWELDFSSLQFWSIIVISIFLHEFMHGFAAGAYNVPIKTVGAIVLPFVLYGGYVNVDFSEAMKDEKDISEDTPERIKEIKSMINFTDLDKIEEIENNMESRIVGVTACGLYANILLLVGSLILIVFINLQWLRYLISANLLLIGLNLLPIIFTDGAKLFQFKILEILPEKIAKKVNSFFTSIIWLLLIPVILF